MNNFNLEDYPYINVKIEAYFRVCNSDTWGGHGSIGYMRMNFEGVKNIQCLSEEFIENWRQNVIKQHKVTSDDVTFITQDEYEAAIAKETDEPLKITFHADENKPAKVSMPRTLFEKLGWNNKKSSS